MGTKLLEGRARTGIISDSRSTKVFVRQATADEIVLLYSNKLWPTVPDVMPPSQAHILNAQSQNLGWALPVLQYPLFSSLIQSLGGSIFFSLSLFLAVPGKRGADLGGGFRGEKRAHGGGPHTPCVSRTTPPPPL